MELEKVFEDVKTVIENSTGIKKETIQLNQTLFDELEVDSIDLVDILFELEHLYNIELKISDIESKAKDKLGDIPYEKDGYITKEGRETIKEFLPELDDHKLKEGTTVHQLVQLFTVQSLCRLVIYRMEEIQRKT